MDPTLRAFPPLDEPAMIPVDFDSSHPKLRVFTSLEHAEGC